MEDAVLDRSNSLTPDDWALCKLGAGSRRRHLSLPGDYLITEDITGASTEVSVTAESTSTVTLTVPGA